VLPKDTDWEVPAPPTDLVFIDRGALETNRLGYVECPDSLLKNAWTGRQDNAVGKECLSTTAPNRLTNQVSKVPDFFCGAGCRQ